MPKLLFFVTEDWAFCQHFLPMARAARDAGFDVVVATRLRNHGPQIAAEGCRVVPLENERRSFGPFEIARSMSRMAAIVRAERPDIVHCIALRMVVLAGLAARWAGAKTLVLAPTGLGHLWIEKGAVERFARIVARFVVRWLRGPRTRFLFENAEDPREFALDPHGPEVTLVGGAGVAPQSFPVSSEPPAPPVKIAVVSRMLIPKGIAEAVAAAQQARAAGAAVELHLFGSPDPSNRTSFQENDLRKWAKSPGIFWHGPAGDVAAVWRDHHIAMLLSYREGLPRALVEAAASGRPIVATDVTGCREVVRNGIEGFLVRNGDIAAAAQAISQLAANSDLRTRMGAAARARFEQNFTEDKVRSRVATLYRSLKAS